MLSSTVAGAGGSLVHVGARILVVGLALTAFPGGSAAALLAQSSLSRCDDHDD